MTDQHAPPTGYAQGTIHIDKYEVWLIKQVFSYRQWCLADVERMGYPGMIKFASQDMRYALEAYEDALTEYQRYCHE